MRTPRLTTQRIMIVVAILAVGFASERHITKLARISDRRRHMASVHATSEQLYRKFLRNTQSYLGTVGCGGARPLASERERRRHAAFLLRMAEYHRGLSRKYEQAACYPWVTLPPDPPRPK